MSFVFDHVTCTINHENTPRNSVVLLRMTYDITLTFFCVYVICTEFLLPGEGVWILSASQFLWRSLACGFALKIGNGHLWLSADPAVSTKAGHSLERFRL